MGTLFTGALLFGAAGRLDWVMGWVVVGVYAVWVGALAVILIPRHPELLAERTGPKKGTKSWDTVLLGGLGLLELAKYVVAGLDVRWGWSRPVPLLLQLAGVALALLGQVGLGVWSMAVNRFFAQTVRIQQERGHAVVTAGPYHYIRHPGYAGHILFQLGTPLILGSLWALVPAGLAVLLLVVRTALEDRTLCEELDGYAAYARRVQSRLLPRVW
jgi:protein-S-isoprenylcysteine O-methyltransferase Ste14